MSYVIQINQYSSGLTGHVNITFIASGVNETYGNNLDPSAGVQREDNKLQTAPPGTLTSIQVSLSEEAFNRALAFARAADILSSNYFGLCNNCVDFANETLNVAGLGSWALASYLTDGTLVDTYAKAAQYLCGSWYIDRATSQVLNILASPTNVADAVQFVNSMSWLVDHENGSAFYFDDNNYTFYSSQDPDYEAHMHWQIIKALGAKLGLSVKYDPIEQKIILGVGSPIVLDLGGDGIQTTEYAVQSVQFDIDGDGVKDRTAWISGSDAFLAIDTDGNGSIDGTHELFGGLERGQGFAKLSAFDDNGDGVVDDSDSRFTELKVWQDANMNGITDDGELRDASTAGLRSITTAYVARDVYQNDNLLGEHSTATWNDRTIEAVDVYFRYKSGAELSSDATLLEAMAAFGANSAPATLPRPEYRPPAVDLAVASA